MRWSQVLGLVVYVSIVQSSTTTTTTTTTTTMTTTTPPRAAAAAASCGLAQWFDVESRTVAASIVVDAVVADLHRVDRTPTGVVLYHARLTVIHVLKGRLDQSVRRPRHRRGRVTISVGTFARATSARPASDVDEELCASLDLPVNGSRYIVFLQPPASPSTVARPPFIYNISSLPQPFSVSILNVIRRCSRRKYGIYFTYLLTYKKCEIKSPRGRRPLTSKGFQSIHHIYDPTHIKQTGKNSHYFCFETNIDIKSIFVFFLVDRLFLSFPYGSVR